MTQEQDHPTPANDVSPEAEAVATPAAESGPTPEMLQAEINELKDKLLRTLAEAENSRRRAEREREDAGKYAVTGFARGLADVADNLRRALDSVPDDARSGNDVLTTLLEGIELTERTLLASFEKAGIRKIDPAVGEKADPNRHEVLFEIPGTDQPAGSILQVVQTGYMIHDRLLRAAKVGVAKAEPGNTQRVDTTI